MANEIEILGIGTVLEAFTKYAEAAAQVTMRNVNTAALMIETDAKRLCPVGTPESTHKPGYKGGRLRSSIHAKPSTSAAELQASVGTDVEYAEFVERGTSKMTARPYLHPAFEKNAPKLQRNLERDLKALIENGGAA